MKSDGSVFPRVLAIGALTIALLAGCSRTTPDIQESTAKGLQTEVVTIARTASAGDLSGALAQLAALETALRQDTAAGTVTGNRSARIQAAIEIVRSDLQAQLAAQTPTPSPTPSVTPKQGNGKGDKGNGGNND
jgi:hypothetical protein